MRLQVETSAASGRAALQPLAQAVQGRRQLLGRERKPAAQVQRRGRVVEPEGEDTHRHNCRFSRLACAAMTFVKPGARCPGNSLERWDRWTPCGTWPTCSLPALALGALAAALAKLLWRRDLAAVRWRRLAGPACAAGVAGDAGRAGDLLGRDGKMVTYGAMVPACASRCGGRLRAAALTARCGCSRQAAHRPRRLSGQRRAANAAAPR